MWYLFVRLFIQETLGKAEVDLNYLNVNSSEIIETHIFQRGDD